MKQKTFNVCYNIDYLAPPIYPNNLVLLGSGGGDPVFLPIDGSIDPDPLTGVPDRRLLSYRRDIKDKKNGTIIGVASYLLHAYKLEVAKKSGSIYCSYTGHHEFVKNGNEYDITVQGNLKFLLRGTINPSAPFSSIVGNKFDNTSAVVVFINGKKENYGNNVLTLNSGQYQVKGVRETYAFS
jgi:hypothetical protein